MAKNRLHPAFQLNGKSYKISALKELAQDYIRLGEPYEEAIGEFLLSWLDDKNHVMVNTSGSTGEPKTIKLRKKHMINSAKATGKYFGLDEDTTALLCLPSRYIAGKMMLVRAMVLGWRLDVVPPKANPLDQVFKRYEFSAMTPFQLDNSVARLHLISKLIVGGGPFSESLKELVADVDTKVYETYGMTETLTHVAIKPLNGPNKTDLIQSLDGILFEKDDRGCLVIHATAFNPKPIVTNDLVELIDESSFRWLGRFDNVINSGGIKIISEVVEEKLTEVIPHRRFFLTGKPDDLLGEKVVLVVEGDKINITLESLEKFEKPKVIYFISNFIETESGKINKVETIKIMNLKTA